MSEPAVHGGGHMAPEPPARGRAHRLSAWERWVRAPLGLLWLVVLLILAVPVCVYMTLLYYAARAFAALAGAGRGRGTGRGTPARRSAGGGEQGAR